MRFKVGDKVKCIKGRYPYIAGGVTYTVSIADGMHIGVDGDAVIKWGMSRFILVAKRGDRYVL